MSESCGNCRFWRLLEDATGECLRRAPQPRMKIELALGREAMVRPVPYSTIWPETDTNGWCGEWQAARV